MASRPTNDEHQKLLRQLLAMQKVLYNGTDSSEPKHGDDETNVSLNDLDGLEAWLLKSNKDLKQQLGEAKKGLQDRIAEVERLRKNEMRLEEALQDQSELAKRLESDLTAAGNVAVGFERNDLSSSAESSKTSPDSHECKALKSMLEAVCAQRDRLRNAVQERDESEEAMKKQVRLAMDKQARLEEDNMELYQRIRFLQNYKQSERSTLLTDGLSTSESALEEGSANSSRRAATKGLGRGVEHRYRRIYESVEDSPWNIFKMQEKLFSQSMPVRKKKMLTLYTIGNHILLLYLGFLVMFSCPTS